MKFYQVAPYKVTHAKHLKKLIPLIISKYDSDDFKILTLKLTSAVLNHNIFDYKNQMEMPTGLALKDDQKYCIHVMTKHFSQKICHDKYINMTPNQIDSLAFDLVAEIKTHMVHGYTYFPYVPIAPVKIVDPHTFAPIVAFKSRYALLQGDARYLTNEEEREITLREQKNCLHKSKFSLDIVIDSL